MTVTRCTTVATGRLDPLVFCVSRRFPRAFLEPLLDGLNQNVWLVRDLLEYSTTEIKTRSLNLRKCPALSEDAVLKTMKALSGSRHACAAIRETENSVLLRVVLEFVFRYAFCIILRDFPADAADVRRSACQLVDCMLPQLAATNLSPHHIFLFVYCVRILVAYNKFPKAATLRLQQLEYLFNPFSRVLYDRTLMELPPPASTDELYNPCEDTVRQQRRLEFRNQILSRALKERYNQLQRTESQNELTEAKARAFAIVGSITKRLFGCTPFLFGSAVSGLATASSDLDVLVLLSRKQRRKLVKLAESWKHHNQPDYSAFPAQSYRRGTGGLSGGRIYRRQQQKRTRKGTIDGSSGNATGLGHSPPATRRRHLGTWKWLTRKSTRESAAVWAARILAPRLALLGWCVECVETARVPIIRVIAAVDDRGHPQEVKPEMCTGKEAREIAETIQEMRQRRYRYLDPIFSLAPECGKRHWTLQGVLHNKTPWSLDPVETIALNLAVDREMYSQIATDIRAFLPPDSCGDTQSTVISQEAASKPSSVRLVYMDIGFNHEVVIHNTRLMKAYVESDPLAAMLCVLIKDWARQRGICKAFDGTLSGYQWTLMVIHFLQQYLVREDGGVHLPVLPNLQLPPRHLNFPTTRVMVDDRFDVYFYHPVRGANRALRLKGDAKFASGSSASLCLSSNTSDPFGNGTSTCPSVTPRWPEEVYEDDSYTYAKAVLTPINIYSFQDLCRWQSSTRDDFLAMRRQAAPRQRDGGVPFPSVVPANTIPVEQRSKKSLGDAFYNFFEYFGFRFNSYTHVVAINRVPHAPQRKVDCFNLQQSASFLAPGEAPCDPCNFHDLHEEQRPIPSAADENLDAGNSGQSNTQSFSWFPVYVPPVVTHDDMMRARELAQTNFANATGSSQGVVGDRRRRDSMDNEDSGSDTNPLQHHNSGSEEEDDDEDIDEDEDAHAMSPSLSDDDEFDDSGDVFASQSERAIRREKRRLAEIRLSRSLTAFRQRQFLCILDPFERNRTIGPSSRERYTDIIGNMVRVKEFLLQAEGLYSKTGQVDVQSSIDSVFCGVTSSQELSSLRSHHDSSDQLLYRRMSHRDFGAFERKQHSPLAELSLMIQQWSREVVPSRPKPVPASPLQAIAAANQEENQNQAVLPRVPSLTISGGTRRSCLYTPEELLRKRGVQRNRGTPFFKLVQEVFGL